MRVVHRRGHADLPHGVEVVSADVAVAAEAARARARGGHRLSLRQPSVREVAGDSPPLMDAIIKAATSAGARLVFGDNLYAYGPVGGPVTEGTCLTGRRAQAAERGHGSRKTLMQAHDAGRIGRRSGEGPTSSVPTRTCRPSGTESSPGRWRGKPAQVLGDPDLPHTRDVPR